MLMTRPVFGRATTAGELWRPGRRFRYDQPFRAAPGRGCGLRRGPAGPPADRSETGAGAGRLRPWSGARRATRPGPRAPSRARRPRPRPPRRPDLVDPRAGEGARRRPGRRRTRTRARDRPVVRTRLAAANDHRVRAREHTVRVAHRHADAAFPEVDPDHSPFRARPQNRVPPPSPAAGGQSDAWPPASGSPGSRPNASPSLATASSIRSRLPAARRRELRRAPATAADRGRGRLAAARASMPGVLARRDDDAPPARGRWRRQGRRRRHRDGPAPRWRGRAARPPRARPGARRPRAPRPPSPPTAPAASSSASLRSCSERRVRSCSSRRPLAREQPVDRRGQVRRAGSAAAARPLSTVRSKKRSRASDASPVTASIRRVFEPMEASETTCSGPIVPEGVTWVPPHSSTESCPASTTRTTSPYFSPKKAMAPALSASFARRLVGPHGLVAQDLGVDEVLDASDLLLGHRPEVAEVESQAVRARRASPAGGRGHRAPGAAPSAEGGCRCGCA